MDFSEVDFLGAFLILVGMTLWGSVLWLVVQLRHGRSTVMGHLDPPRRVPPPPPPEGRDT